MYCPTAHHLSRDLPATAPRSQAPPEAGKVGHARDLQAQSCFSRSIPAHMQQGSHGTQQQLK